VTSDLEKVKTDVKNARIDIDDVQERNHAFKYYVYNNNYGAVKSGTIVNFDRKSYGSGVVNGIYTAPIVFSIK